MEYLKNKPSITVRISDMKIKEVAARVNLGIENYFYTMFKKRYGISPLEYRKKCRDEN